MLLRRAGPSQAPPPVRMLLRIQPAMLSVRALLSTAVCGQLGPLLTTETSTGRALPRSRKNGAPESYGQGVVSGWGAYPWRPVTESLSDTTVIWPVRSRVTGAGFTLVVEP